MALELKVSRNTVRAALAADCQPSYTRKAGAHESLLVPFYDAIREMLFEKRFIGSRILREIGSLGYQGGPALFYKYLQSLKAQTPDSRVTERFETGPGEQAQFDWSTYSLSLGGTVQKVSIFGCALAFSRRKFYWPSLDQTTISCYEAIENSFAYFGGATKQLLVDNPRAFVLDPNPAHFQWNPHFMELCGHLRVEPRACRPYRARTKGKIERPFFYLEQHFIKGRSWSSLQDLTADLLRFCQQELDLMLHSTTQERPLDRFQREKDLLTPLPASPFISTGEEVRKVSWDCLVPYQGNRYAVPVPYAGKQVWLRPSRGSILLVRNQKGEIIITHNLASGTGHVIIPPGHYQKLRQQLPRTRPLLEQAFLRLFPDHAWFLEAMAIQYKFNWTSHLRHLLGLAEVYPQSALAAALATAKDFNTYSHYFIRGLLEANTATLPQPHPQSPPIPTGALPPSDPCPPANLAAYQCLLEKTR